MNVVNKQDIIIEKATCKWWIWKALVKVFKLKGIAVDRITFKAGTVSATIGEEEKK